MEETKMSTKKNLLTQRESTELQSFAMAASMQL